MNPHSRAPPLNAAQQLNVHTTLQHLRRTSFRPMQILEEIVSCMERAGDAATAQRLLRESELLSINSMDSLARVTLNAVCTLLMALKHQVSTNTCTAADMKMDD